MKSSREYGECDYSWSSTLRTARHSPCLMKPTSAIMMIVLCLIWFVSFAFRFPSIILGLLAGPLVSRSYWMIEFLYPMGIARWGHLLLIRLITGTRKSRLDDANKGYHSRAIETRVEVIKDRVYIHPLPQLLDNLGYLVVCLPSSNSEMECAVDDCQLPDIVAFVVDCGDAAAVIRQIALISELHYQKRTIQIQSILSTHKHHDHTAGNYDLVQDPITGVHIKHVFGGAVEEVPHCTFRVTNGELLPLPKSSTNDMNDVVEVEVIATPGHTRGSVTYALRPVHSQSSSGAVYLFTGDTVFSGGGGVPFEADSDPNQEAKVKRMTANSFIKASASLNAVERCFAEILYRSVKQEEVLQVSSDLLLLFPGHEYTHELLTRQLLTPDNSKWRNTPPAVFFETMSHYYVASQRRTLPHSTGKLLCVPSSIRTETSINPHFRNLRMRGELILTAIRTWNCNWATTKVTDNERMPYGVNDTTTIFTSFKKPKPPTTPSSEKQWNLDANILNKRVFTTVYSRDLDSVIEDLQSGRIASEEAVTRLIEMKSSLYTNVVVRRPIPGTLPSDRSIYKSLLGLVLLGSAPTALTLSDSRNMKLKRPIDTNSDCICISKRRLITVLYHLGLLDANHSGQQSIAIIHNLWKEAFEYEIKTNVKIVENIQHTTSDGTIGEVDCSPANTDVESSLPNIPDDEVSLGALKWILYGIPGIKKSSLFSFCRPCSSGDYGSIPATNHPAGQSNFKVHTGELVRHDLFNCKLSESATGLPTILSRARVNNNTILNALRVVTHSNTPLSYGSVQIVDAVEESDDSIEINVKSKLCEI